MAVMFITCNHFQAHAAIASAAVFFIYFFFLLRFKKGKKKCSACKLARIHLVFVLQSDMKGPGKTNAATRKEENSGLEHIKATLDASIMKGEDVKNTN